MILAALTESITLTPVIGENYHSVPSMGAALTVDARITQTISREPSYDRAELNRGYQVWAQDERLKDWDVWVFEGKTSLQVLHYNDFSGNYNHTVMVF